MFDTASATLLELGRNPKTITDRSIATREDLRALWAASADEIWVGGTGGLLVRGDGSAFAPVDSATTSAIHELWGSGSNDIYTTRGQNLRQEPLNGMGKPEDRPAPGNRKACPCEVYALSLEGLLHWDGSAWTAVDTGSAVPMSGLWGASATDVWLAGAGGTLAHWDGSAWTAQETGTRHDLVTVQGQGDSVWLVGPFASLLTLRR